MAVFLVGAGCADSKASLQSSPSSAQTYENVDYGFVFDFSKGMEMKPRPQEQQATLFYGLPANFFASLRDLNRPDEKEIVSIAYFYVMENVSLDQFTSALTASDPQNVRVLETTDLSSGGLNMKKIVSTTASGINKTNYLFWRETNAIVVSVMLEEEPVFDPILQTFRIK